MVTSWTWTGFTLVSYRFNSIETFMDTFQNTVEPPKRPFAMRVVGSGVIVSCLLLSSLFAWGIYIDLEKLEAQRECANQLIEFEGETAIS